MAPAKLNKPAAKRKTKKVTVKAKAKSTRSTRKGANVPNKKKLRLSTARLKIARSLKAADVVANAKQLLKDGKKYPKGCSEFVCAVLGIGYKVAEDIMGAGADVDGNSIGTGPDYSNVNAGDICGWLKEDATSGDAHVTVYIGDKDAKFIDVKGPGNTPRALTNGYGPQQVWKAQNTT
jgi:hypothetical protein